MNRHRRPDRVSGYIVLGVLILMSVAILNLIWDVISMAASVIP